MHQNMTGWDEKMLNKILGKVHGRMIFDRRVNVLVSRIGDMVQSGTVILDVGTGDGRIAKMIGEQKADTSVQGIDIMLRDHTHIPVTLFDGTKIPMDDNSVDTVTFVDVLHHTNDPEVLIHEAARVARKAVIIKDHLSETALDNKILRIMDWVGNAPHGVVLPYNYAPRRDWDRWFEAAGLTTDRFETDIPLYPFPLNLVFGRKLHFVGRFTPS
jgi:SAM-dependent methyltransferase